MHFYIYNSENVKGTVGIEKILFLCKVECKFFLTFNSISSVFVNFKKAKAELESSCNSSLPKLPDFNEL